MRQIAWKLTFLSGLLLVTAVACTEPATSRAPTATAVADVARREPAVIVVEVPRTYTIVAGDFLSEIAARFEISLQELTALNGIEDAALIEVGQVLTIPGEPELVFTDDFFTDLELAGRWELSAPPSFPPPPPEPSSVQELIDRVAAWPWPPRQDMVGGGTIAGFAFAALSAGFVLTKLEYRTRRWGVVAAPGGARRGFRWWGAAALIPRRSYLATRAAWRSTADGRRATSRRYRRFTAATSAGWARTSEPRRRAVRQLRSVTTFAVVRVHALIDSVRDRAPEAAEGLNAIGGRASTSVRRGVKSARREVFESSEPKGRWRTTLAAELAAAFERRQLQVRYVPVIDLDMHALSAVEAHLFWQHPQRGLIGARDIYPGTDEHPELGAALLEYLLEESCGFLKERVDQRFPSAQLIVPITLQQIVESEPLAAIDRGLTSANLALDRLKIAISESDALRDPLTATAFIRNLRSMGIGVFLDDYGAATADDLGNLRVSSVTVDFAAAGTSSEARERLSAAVEAAQELRLPVTARHARSEAAQRLQVGLGCSFAAVGEPVPADTLVNTHVVERRERGERRGIAGDALSVDEARPANRLGVTAESASDRSAEGPNGDLETGDLEPAEADVTPAAGPDASADEAADTAPNAPADPNEEPTEEAAGDTSADTPPTTSDVAFGGTARARGEQPVLMNRPSIVRREIVRGGPRRVADGAGEPTAESIDSAAATDEDSNTPEKNAAGTSAPSDAGAGPRGPRPVDAV